MRSGEHQENGRPRPEDASGRRRPDAATARDTACMQVDDPAVTLVGGAADRGELRLVHQPIVGLADGAPVAVEALVRWRHPRLGLLGPESFLPRLARDGELHLLDDWVLRTAVAEFAAWPGRAAGATLHVNVSGDRLGGGDGLGAVLAELADAAGLARGQLCVEVADPVVRDSLDTVAPALAAVVSAGAAVVVDDVGAAGTSVRHLAAAGASGLKIDRSYVAGLLDSPRDRAVVRSLVDLGAAAGVTVTAVGVETAEQAAVLLDMGCTRGQGWLFGRPGPLA